MSWRFEASHASNLAADFDPDQDRFVGFEGDTTPGNASGTRNFVSAMSDGIMSFLSKYRPRYVSVTEMRYVLLRFSVLEDRNWGFHASPLFAQDC
jgi:hypothetical protein